MSSQANYFDESPNIGPGLTPEVQNILDSKIAYYDSFAPDYDSTRFAGELGAYITVESEAALIKLVKELGYAGRSDWSALDIATGTGRVAIALARQGARLTALDAAPAMLQRCQKNVTAAGLQDRVSFVMGNAAQLPFPDGSFEVVFACRFMHLLPVAIYPKIMREMARVTAPGGRLVLEFTNLNYGPLLGRYRLRKMRRENGKLPHTYVTRRQLSRFGEEAGLDIQLVIGTELPKGWLFAEHQHLAEVIREMGWGPLKGCCRQLIAVFRDSSR